MFDKNKAIATLNENAASIAAENKRRFENELDKKLNYGLSKCARYVKNALISGGLSSSSSGIESAKDYGPWLLANKFKAVENVTTQVKGGVFSVSGQQAGDVVVIAAAPGHKHGHIAMFNGTKWVSDYVQDRGFYPAQVYRENNTPYVLYRHEGSESRTEGKALQKGKINICFPITRQNGQEFSGSEDILAHLAGETTGLYAIGRNGMWHGGIHITSATTPWCALSGRGLCEAVDFPGGYKGEQALRCMADGEVVAYRICRDSMQIPWETGPLSFSGSFLLVRHYIQPGETEKSGLHFYTLYMHLAPWSAYEGGKNTQWITSDRLSAYAEADWLIMELSHSEEKPVKAGVVSRGTHVRWEKSDTSLISKQGGRTYGLVTLNENSGNLKKGQRVWVLVDNNNIKPAPGAVPSWWRHILPPAREVMKFDEVVSPGTAFRINAGDSVGHLGYYQAAKDGGYDARYQVHIECMSMDDNLEAFLCNPEKVGAGNPRYLKYSPGLALYKKDIPSGTFVKDGRVTGRNGILTLSQVTTEKDAKTEEEYWQLRPENGYVPKGQAEPQLLSQYDLGALGFKTVTDSPASFDHLDGKTQPNGLVRSLYEFLLAAARDDTRFSHALVPFNYQRLLNKIDSGISEYSAQEYLRAIHNPSYREVLQKTIVKHPSDWYHRKEDSIWQKFLKPLQRDAPEWKSYSEAFIEQMAWMRDVKTENLGPSLWHMHPIRFLGMLQKKQRYIINYTKYPITFDDALNKQVDLGIRSPLYGPQIGTKTGFVPVNKEIVSLYMNPAPFEKDENKGMFQFMILTSYVGIPKEAIALALKGKGILDGKEDSFIQAAKLHNINEMYLVAHAIVETGHGTSKLATGNQYKGNTYYNMYGVGAYDGVAVSEGTKFAAQNNWHTPEAAIVGGAEFTSRNFFSRGQNTLYKMRWNPQSPGKHQYATAVNWAETQAGIIYKMAMASPDSIIYFDFPIYEE